MSKILVEKMYFQNDEIFMLTHNICARIHTYVRTHLRTRVTQATLITTRPTAGTAAYNAPRRFIYHPRTRKSPVNARGRRH